MAVAAFALHNGAIAQEVWRVEDLDGDLMQEELPPPGAVEAGTVALVLSSGQHFALMRLDACESLAFELCGRIDDLDGDGLGDLVLTAQRATGGGGMLFRCRFYTGVPLQFRGQLVGGWDAHGAGIAPVLQAPGDARSDGFLDAQDLLAALGSAAPGEEPEFARVTALAADWRGDGDFDWGDLSRVIEAISAGGLQSDRIAVESLRAKLTQHSSAGLLGFILRIFGVVDCVWCAEHFAEEIDAAREWVEEVNEQLRECRACMETGDCPLEVELECWRLYRQVQIEWARRLRDAANGAAPCIKKCAGALEVLS